MALTGFGPVVNYPLPPPRPWGTLLDTLPTVAQAFIYTKLIREMESMAEADWDATLRHRMVQVVNDAVGEAIHAYIARCEKCDLPIQLTCDECLKGTNGTT